MIPSEQQPDMADPICEGCGQPIHGEAARSHEAGHLAPIAHAACRVAVWALLTGLLDL